MSTNPASHVNGRFAPGNKLGHGNGLLKKMGMMHRQSYSAITAGEIKEIGAKLKEVALDGNVHAAKLLLDHTLGKPPQAIAISGPEGTPLGLTLADIQMAVFQAVGDDGKAKVRIATALRQLAHKETENGKGHARSVE